MTVSKKLLNRYSTDVNLEENGVWVDFGDGIRIRVRRIRSKKSLEVRKELERPYTSDIRKGPLPESTMETLLLQQMAHALVVDWEGIVDDNEQPIPCTPDNITEVMAVLTDLRDEVLQVSISADSYRTRLDEEALTNLMTTSAGH